MSSEALPVAILAGGLATRIRPLTEQVPKALLEVAGRPFIDWQLDYLRTQGIGRVVLCIGYRGEQIESRIGTGSAFGLEVRYSPDGPKLLGTGGALRKALPLLGPAFFVLYGDSYLPVDFADVQRSFESAGKPGLMTVLQNQDRWDKSNALYQDGKVIEYDKRSPRPEMRHIDYGLGVLTANALKLGPGLRRGDESPRDESRGDESSEAFDLADVYHRLSIEGNLAGYEVHQRFYEIGSHAGLADTEKYLSNHKA